ncbi:helix-turn-helix domain-containing protein [Salibacterium lacus]|uniref:Helix-turn-helix domain-containing protein n=1 Tax=Salibacterium lacus TaxID=1898109 RepID=A0ABW5SXF8_9BACI
MQALSFRRQMFLLLAERMNQERSIQALYHILTGKKSSQTIQDIKWYNVTYFFRMFPYWKETEFENDTNDLQYHRYIASHNNRVLITEQGRSQNDNFRTSYSWPPIYNGWLYGKSAAVFWKRTALFVQCLSQTLAGNRRFLPVFEDISVQHWLKKNWPKTIEEKQQTASVLFDELRELLGELDERDAFLIMNRLTGYHLTGQTWTQLSTRLQMSEDECHFRFLGSVHFLLEHADRSAVLRRAASGLEVWDVLTETTKKTLHYMNEGWGMERIARVRNLKRSTIEDHVVEIASEQTGFPIGDYVAKEDQNLILHHASALETKRLKVLKEAAQPKELDYFSIRLTLAFYGRDNHGQA